ncbi:MAG: winged helix-turn-helix domain-containing protein [Candidatus Thermoplasmatota archaeon]|nr:winged helix-turn-helix domain-containing protein [Candidatus Thermoplasmatota archaeon]
MAEDLNPEEEQNTLQEFPVKRIRSGVRRRIMEFLSEGRATVTQISSNTNLRLPHASAELKRLRKEGLVFSDEETGSRGACLALTAGGWDVLRADEIARIRELTTEPSPAGALGRLISVSGSNLLIAFVRRPIDGPIAIPNRPLDATRKYSTDDVWTWIEPRERKPRWMSSDTFHPVPPPSREIDSSNISSWGAESQVWGVQRFRLVDESHPLRLASGSWFGEYEDLQLLSLPERVPHDGQWRLGSIAIGGPIIRMDTPLVALGLDRMSREALLTAASRNAVTLAPRGKIDVPTRSIPFGVLERWVEIAHPRLRSSERKERLRILTEALSKSGELRQKRKVDDTTWRRFRKHWGDVPWSSEPLNNGDWIDSGTLSNKAEKSLIEWSLSQTNSNLVIEARPSSQSIFSESRLPENVRLIISNTWNNPPTANHISPHPVLPSMWSRISLLEGMDVPVNLVPSISTEALFEDVIWRPPSSAEEVEKAKIDLGGQSEGSSIPNLSFDEDKDRLMRAAVLSYPMGDSEWANRMEPHYPLISWIASTPADRWSRWERIGDVLGSDWMALMKSVDIPNEYLSLAATQGPPAWKENFVNEIRSRIRVNPELAHILRHSSESTSPEESAWVAHILLSEVAWFPPELQSDLASWGIDRFLEDPPARCSAVISGLDWLGNQYPERLLSESEDWRQHARSIGYSKPQDHDLHLWAVLDDWYETGNRPHSTVMSLILQRLPEEWWAPVSEIILTVLSDDSDGIELIAKMDISWPSLILRPEGEIHRIPGGSSVQHGGVRRTLLARLERLTENEKWIVDLPGARMIGDLSQALRDARNLSPPKFGMTHPMVGWLAIPTHRWPPTEVIQRSSGDIRITARLAKSLSGWHADLSRTQMDY